MGIIGRQQVVSDIPAHRFMAFSVDRDLDKTARGLGGTRSLPITTVGVENLTKDEGDRWAAGAGGVARWGERGDQQPHRTTPRTCPSSRNCFVCACCIC